MTTLPQDRESTIIPAQSDGVTVLRRQAFLAILVGLALRLVFAFRFPATADDSATYIQLAQNWIDHHVYGLWVNGHLVPTDLRPPGYPAFLAGVAMILGRTTRAIMLSQVVVDLGTCFLAAALSAALAPVAARRRVAMAALWLAVTCPFVSNYSAVVLSEVLAAFLTTGALLLFAAGLAPEASEPVLTISNWRLTPLRLALLGSFLTGLATLVRPEMPLLFAVAGVTFALRWWKVLPFRKLVLNGVAMAGAFLLPVAPWAARNLIVLHEVQFLSPRYSTLPGEYATVGYFAWTNTWLERYRDVYLNIWKIGEEPVEIEDLPDEAFDSPQEKQQVAEVFQQYNSSPTLDISPEMDRVFARIARERTGRNPLRTYVRVPFQRALTLWFTPRTELLPIDGKLRPIRDQWNDSHAAFLTTAGFAALGYLYVALALGGIWAVWRAGRAGGGAPKAQGLPNLWGVGLLLAYLLARTAFLTTIEAPEPRYVVTCYPTLWALAALLCSRAAGNQARIDADLPQRSSTGSG